MTQKLVPIPAHVRGGVTVRAHVQSRDTSPGARLSGDAPPLQHTPPLTPARKQGVSARIARKVASVLCPPRPATAAQPPQPTPVEPWTDARLQAWRAQQGANPAAEQRFASQVHPAQYRQAIRARVRDADVDGEATATQHLYARAVIERRYWDELLTFSRAPHVREYALAARARAIAAQRSVDARTGWPTDYLQPLADVRTDH